jgi:hypothetical protein
VENTLPDLSDPGVAGTLLTRLREWSSGQIQIWHVASDINHPENPEALDLQALHPQDGVVVMVGDRQFRDLTLGRALARACMASEG